MVTSDTCGDVSPSHGDKPPGKVSSKDINECIAGWLAYLQVWMFFLMEGPYLLIKWVLSFQYQ